MLTIIRCPLRRLSQRVLSAFLLLAFVLGVPAALGEVPSILHHQGRVVVDGVNFDGSGQFRFALVSGNGSTTYWSNDGTSVGGSEPAAAVTLPVIKGLYSVLLGNTALSNMVAVPPAVFEQSDVRLRIWFDDGSNGSQLLTPDQRLAPAGYAMSAASSENLASNGNVLVAIDRDNSGTGSRFTLRANGSAPDLISVGETGFAAFQSSSASGALLIDSTHSASTTNLIEARASGTAVFRVQRSGNVLISGAILDAAQSPGSAGQILSSTGSQINWITPDAQQSDRHAKEAIRPVDPAEVLEKLERLPISSWQLKNDERGIRHIGAMAQDFYSAFQVGADNRHISLGDASGVAFAAIQALHQKLRKKGEAIEALLKANAALSARLDRIEEALEEK